MLNKSVVVLGVITTALNVSRAGAGESLPVGWYDAMGYYATLGNIAEAGGNITLAYHWAQNPEYVQLYLDAALDAGMKVIVEVPRAHVTNQDTAALSAFVESFDSHPSVYGWYTADEPALTGVSVQATEVAYAAVKQASQKPVFMAFNAEESRNRETIRYREGYDILLYDDYPLHTDDSLFEDLGTYRGNVERVRAQSVEIGKPWWMIPQAMGRATGTTWDYRLPTSAEERFMSYWAIVNDAEGLLYWAHYRTLQTIANPSMPYPRSGELWIPEVWEPLAAEINLMGAAIMAGELTGLLSDNRSDVESRLYRDPETGEYYLIAVNDRSGNESATFTLDLPEGDYDLSRLNGDFLPLIGNQFTDMLTSFDVHVYRVSVPEPSSALGVGAGLLISMRGRGRQR